MPAAACRARPVPARPGLQTSQRLENITPTALRPSNYSAHPAQPPPGRHTSSDTACQAVTSNQALQQISPPIAAESYRTSAQGATSANVCVRETPATRPAPARAAVAALYPSRFAAPPRYDPLRNP